MRIGFVANPRNRVVSDDAHEIHAQVAAAGNHDAADILSCRVGEKNEVFAGVRRPQEPFASIYKSAINCGLVKV